MERRQALCLLGRSVVALGAAKFSACGREEVFSPTEAGLTLRSCRTGDFVVGARVTVEGEIEVFVSDVQGIVDLPYTFSGKRLFIEAPGFIRPRVIRFVSGAIDYLWEDDVALPFSYTKKIVYDDGAHPLQRPVKSLITVFPFEKMLADPRGYQAVHEAVAIIDAADVDVAYRIVYADESAEMKVTIEFNPDDPVFKESEYAGAVTQLYLANHVITRGRIVFKTLDAFWGDHLRKAVAHELGHVRGLGHAPDGMGMMGSTEAVADFSVREKEVMRNLFRRVPGNVMPDSGLAMVAAATAAGGWSTVCALC